jgi:hypothetical protein
VHFDLKEVGLSLLNADYNIKDNRSTPFVPTAQLVQALLQGDFHFAYLHIYVVSLTESFR